MGNGARQGLGFPGLYGSAQAKPPVLAHKLVKIRHGGIFIGGRSMKQVLSHFILDRLAGFLNFFHYRP